MTFWDILQMWLQKSDNQNMLSELATSAGFSPHRFKQLCEGENLLFHDCAKFARWVNETFTREFGVAARFRFCDLWPDYVKPFTPEQDMLLFVALRAMKKGKLLEEDVKKLCGGELPKKSKLKPDDEGNYDAQEVYDFLTK